MRALWLTFPLLLLIAPLSSAQENSGSPFVRLATYWDAPGDVKAVSADDRWLVITDRATEISRLVEIETGDVLTEQPRNDVIYFSPDGRYASVYDVESGNTQIIDLERKAVTYEAPVGRILIRFSTNSRYGVAGFVDSDQQNYHAQVMNVETGDVLIDVPGWNEALSPTGEFIAVTDPQTGTASVYDVTSGKLVLDWPLIEYTEGRASASSIFSPDGRWLVIYQPHNFISYVFEIGTWQWRYEIVGYPGFSADGRYILSNRHARYSHVFLYEAATGTLLDEVDGDMYFSADGKLLFRRQGAFDGDSVGTIQVIGLPSLRRLIEISGAGYDSLSAEPRANNTLVRVFKQIQDIGIPPPVTQFIDLGTGEIIREFSGSADLIDPERNLLHVDGISWLGQPDGRLMDWETGEVFIWEGGIQLSSTGKYIITSNGLFVDIYGAPEDRLNSISPPRPDSGIGTMEPDDITIYTVPDAANPLVETTLNRLTFYVLGQTADGEWLYGTGMLNERREGWLRADQLTMVKPWDHVPVLDTADPLGSLRNMASNAFH